MTEEQDTDLDDGGKVMTLFEHLQELRTVLFRSVLAVLVFFVISMFFSKYIINFLKTPLMNSLPDGANALHFTGPMDVFIASIKVSLLSSVIVSCPVWLHQFWWFLKPGLYPKEQRLILPFSMISVALFLTGICFCFFLILPLALEFLIGLGLEVGTPIITINDYLSMLIVLLLGFGLVFETPVVLVLLAMLDLVSAKALREFRPIVLVIILVMAALFTPPDPISQVAMAVPVYLMYEISIFVIRIIEKKPA